MTSTEKLIYSIDQNCNSLWDVPPKLHALGSNGYFPTQFLEDVDVAYTRHGAGVNSVDLRIERERYYKTGGADWGAAMFYSEFLGRVPVDIRLWEPMTGMTTKALAKALGTTIDDLYERYSPSDNWQLVGSSYVGDARRHRVLGDLDVSQIRPWLIKLLDIARADMMRSFPADQSQEMLKTWWEQQQSVINTLLETHSKGKLIDLYRQWLDGDMGPRDGVSIDTTSRLFELGRDRDQLDLLELFTRQYDLLSQVYNQALDDTNSDLHPLDTSAGELPFFAVYNYQGHMVRSEVFLRDNMLVLPDKAFRLGAGGAIPVDELSAFGVRCLVGKAILLMIQARIGQGAALALPYLGSLYSPAATRLEWLLKKLNLVKCPVKPIMRVRLRLLDRLRYVDTPIQLPAHLSSAFSNDVIAARELGERWEQIRGDSAWNLSQLSSEADRRVWRKKNFPQLTAKLDSLDDQRRALARSNAPAEQMRNVWKQMKPILEELTRKTIERIDRDWQLANMDYWDSRGAILPWCLALGGEQFYHRVVQGARIYEERQTFDDV